MRAIVLAALLSACGGVTPKSLGHAAVDCLRSDRKQLIEELTPAVVSAVQAATSLDGDHVDTASLLLAAAKAISPVARCVWATAFAKLAKPSVTDSTAPQAAPFVVSRSAVLEAFEALRPALGGDRFDTPEGSI